MFAVIQTGGKQYLVRSGESIKIEKLDAEEGDEVEFDQVLMVGEEEKGDIKIGDPYLEDTTVTATVEEQGKGDKIRVTKFKRKKRYKKVIGHRQAYTKVKIGDF